MNERMTARLSALAAVSDPPRRALFDFVRRSDAPVSRDDAAAAAGMPRSTAAFHLDRLVEEGALAVEFKRVGGKTGPGSGRPSKLYHPVSAELSASVPDRDYELAGELLAAAIDQADRSGEPVREALTRVAVEAGRELGLRAGSLEAALDDTGYEPTDDGAGGMLLINCPFHQLATSHTEVICHANLGLLKGVAEGVGDVEHDIRFSPADGRCCVHIAARGRAKS